VCNLLVFRGIFYRWCHDRMAPHRRTTGRNKNALTYDDVSH
jgi:hypothetical protein